MPTTVKRSNSQLYHAQKSPMKSSRDWIVLLQTLFVCLVVCPAVCIQCISTKANGIKIKETGFDRSIVVNYTDEGNITECNSDSDYCFTLLLETANKTYVVQSQGCWKHKGSDACKLQQCIADKSPKAKNDSKFCCCSANLCNKDYTVKDGEPESSENKLSHLGYNSVEHATNNTKASTIVLVCTFPLTIIGVAVFVFFRVYGSKRKTNSDSVQRIVSPPSFCQTFDIDKLTIEKMIGKGKYGSVHLGKMDDNKEVAVKIFSHENEQYFRNENEIYSLPFMDHPCLVKFIGAKERIDEIGKTEYLLVLSYSPSGCLQDYLRNHTINWAGLCKISKNLTSGLAYLHTAVFKDDKIKPCVAHRDLTSRNVLIRNDGGCMICDFGFAICLQQGKYYRNGELKVAETTPLADVGTLRYMAPEVLEGAVNLRDCETSLKQADVYALGLILWEIASRCSDVFQGMEVPPYRLPFDRELNGLKPSMEQMQVLVARNKARPLFPDIWKDTNPAIKELKETIEDCWDHDADARLTTEGAVERLIEVSKQWESHKANFSGLSPIVNVTNTSPPSSSSVVINVPDSETPGETLRHDSESDPKIKVDIGENCENTLETVVASLPSEHNFTSSMPNTKDGATKNSNSSIVSKLSVPLQPHQGYNPSMERNLMKDVEKDARNDVFLERGYKDDVVFEQYSKQNVSLQNRASGNGATSNDASERIDRICHPIPYVQNIHLKTTIPNQNSLETKSFNGLFNCRNPRQERKRKCINATRSSLKGFFERRRTSKEHKILEEERQPLKSSTGNELCIRKSNEENRSNDSNFHLRSEREESALDRLYVAGRPISDEDSRAQNGKIPLTNGNDPRLARDGEILPRTGREESLLFSVYNHVLANDVK
ncbi:activin receptor type-2B-like [Centruroides vittatus]|uniref:activin receptor type-2B-like n=1 Tax=Centruroides vittatus TaxID=120091 RepID=UPI00350FAAC5